MPNDIRIQVYGENHASPALQAVETDSDKAAKSIDNLGQSAGRASQHAQNASRSTKELSERTENLDDTGQKATSSLGALSSGFELIGNTKAAGVLQSTALATDFLSGVGEGATLVVDKLGGAFKAMGTPLATVKAGLGKVKEGFSDASSTAGKVTTGFLAVAAAAAVLVATYKVLNAAFDNQKISAADTKTGLEQIAASGQVTNDSLKGLSSNTGLLQHDLDSLNGTMGQHLKNLGDQDLGLHIWAEGSGKTSDRIKALDQSLTDMVNSGHADQAAQAFKVLSDQAAQSGVSVKELQGGLPLYTEAQKNATVETNDAVTAQEGWKAKLDETTAALSAQDDEINAVANSLKAQTDPLFGFIDAQKDLTDKTKALADATHKHGENSREAKDATEDYQKAVLNYVGAAAKASSGTGHLTDAQKNLLTSAGLSKTAVKKLDDQLYDAWKKAQKLDGFNIDIDVTQHFKQTGKYISSSQIANPSQLFSGLAHGGVKGAASGATSSGLTWTGEDGPELLDLPPGTGVHTKGDSQRMMAQQGGGDVQVIVSFDKAGLTGLALALVETMRAEISHQGGNVQRVLGVPGAM